MITVRACYIVDRILIILIVVRDICGAPITLSVAKVALRTIVVLFSNVAAKLSTIIFFLLFKIILIFNKNYAVVGERH